MSAKDTSTPPMLTLVEDEFFVRELLARALRLWKFPFQVASNAREAVQLLEGRLTPIVITDIHMPGEGGLWLVREVRRRWPQTAVIVLTGAQDNGTAIQCLNAGASRYFLKPVQLDEFRRGIESAYEAYLRRQADDHYHQHLEITVHRQGRKLRRQFLSTIDSLVRTLEARDPCTSGHSQRVRRYAMRLADVLNLDERQRRRLSLAAKLHDIGKFGVPESILHKPGQLTPAEQEVMRQHPVISERILAPVIRDREILAAVRGHHERVDGSGYPDGLAGEQVPVLARMLTIADCFDALTTGRAYRAPLPVAYAVDMLRSGAGSHFDPALVATFTEAVAPAFPVLSQCRTASA